MVFELHGGIGNQLFQYCAARNAANNNSQIPTFDCTHIHMERLRAKSGLIQQTPLQILKLPGVYMRKPTYRLVIERVIRKLLSYFGYFHNRVLLKFPLSKSFESTQLGFDSSFAKVKNGRVFGYFQTFRYCPESLRQEISLALSLMPKSSWTKKIITRVSSPSVLLLHYRAYPNLLEDKYAVLEENYYETVISKVQSIRNVKSILILTNSKDRYEMDFSKDFRSKCELLESPEGIDDLEILSIMSEARNFAISNSTF